MDGGGGRGRPDCEIIGMNEVKGRPEKQKKIVI
jgi:hypothetical protein